MDNNNEMPKNRFGLKLIFSILEILSCCLLNPITLILGIVSLILTCNANASYKSGKMDEFRNAAKKATVLLLIGLAFDVLIAIIWAVTIGNINKEIKNRGYDNIREYYEEMAGKESKSEKKEAEGSASNAPASADPDSTEWLEEDDDIDYTLADPDQLGEYWKFTLDGNSFELPLDFSKLMDAGYTFDDEDPTTVMLEGKDCIYDSILDKKGEVLLGEIEVYNPSDEEKPESECVVVSFTLYDDTAYDGNYEQTLGLVGGLGFGSTMDEVRSALGDPSYTDDSNEDDEEIPCDEWILDDDFFNVLYIGYLDGKVAYFCADYWGSYDPTEAVYTEEDDGDDEYVLDDDDFIFDDDDIVIE